MVNVELTLNEAELLIAVLMFAESVAPLTNPALVPAIADLKRFRTDLIGKYLDQRFHGPSVCDHPM